MIPTTSGAPLRMAKTGPPESPLQCRGGGHPAECYEQQNKFWSSYRRHSCNSRSSSSSNSVRLRSAASATSSLDRSNSRSGYPMLTGSVCIASKTRAKMSTLQAVAPIPAFMAGSKRWLRRRNGAAGVGFAFEGISFAFWLGRTPRPSVAIRTAQRNTKV